MDLDPGSLDVDSGQLELSRLTEEKSLIATDTTMDNLSEHTIGDDLDSKGNELNYFPFNFKEIYTSRIFR